MNGPMSDTRSADSRRQTWSSREGPTLLATGAVTRPAAPGQDFATIWEQHVMPLAWRRLDRRDGTSNTVVAVDWSGVQRITSSGRPQFIKIEIFEWAVNRILSRGWVERDEINQEHLGRASSAIVLILSQVPLFRLVGAGRLTLQSTA